MDNIQIIILAAGKGTRMKSELPKALTPLRGKPFLKHVLDAVHTMGLPRKPIVVVGHKKELVIEALGSEQVFAMQEEQLGTGHAVRAAEKLIDPSVDTIVVLFSDQPLMKGETILKLIAEHKKNTDAVMTMATVELGDFSDWKEEAFDNFGRILRNPDGTIARIVERKNVTEDEQKITEVNPAYFVFNAQWMWEKLRELKNDNSQGEYYLVDLPLLAFQEGSKIHDVPIDYKEALGANTKEQLELLERLSEEEK